MPVPDLRYKITIAPPALEDLKAIPKNIADTILRRIDVMEKALPPSVKRLNDFRYEYRLRVGDYRILFDVRNKTEIIVGRIRHRSRAYRR